MKIKLKIAAGVVAGVIAGTTLMGSAFATPRIMSNLVSSGYGMMSSSVATGTFSGSIGADMQSFMDLYRDSTGRIDMNRMHSDVVSGKVTPPRHNRAQSPVTRTPGSGYRMMRGSSAPVQGSGYGMMGGTY